MATTKELGKHIVEAAQIRTAPRPAPYVYDQIILGGGPAGLTAAVYSARKRVDLLIITEDIGGQMLWTSEVENYMGFHYISALDLIEKFHTQVEQFPIALLPENGAVALSKVNQTIYVTTRRGERYAARTLIIASGKRSRPLGIESEKKFVGRGVTYCSVCDIPSFKGMDVAVMGGGNSGLTAVIDCMDIVNHVYCINNSETLKADPVLVERARQASNVDFLLGYAIKEICGDDCVRSIILENKGSSEVSEIPVRGVFVEVGLIPNTEFAAGFLTLNKWNEIIVDSGCRTNVDAIYAAGDVTDVPEKQIIVAAGEGAKASLAAYNCLIRYKTQG